MEKIVMYGADWCSMTKRSQSLLDGLNVDYDYINIDNDPEAAAWVREQANGKEKKPTIKIDAEVLVEPSDAELTAALKRNNRLN